MPGRVAIVDDEEHVRLSTAALLTCAGYTAIVFESGQSFLETETEDLAAVLVDLRMPYPDGMAVLSELQKRKEKPAILLLTGHGDVDLAVKAMKLGADDFLEKPYDANQMIERLEAAIASTSVASDDERSASSRLVQCLSARQRDVLLGMVRGQSNKVIAFDLGLSTRTIEAYRAQLLEKLGVKTSAEAIRLAVLGGLNPPR
jgi:two-component system response regulator FixJ